MKTKAPKAQAPVEAERETYPSPETSLAAVIERHGLEGRPYSAEEFEQKFGHRRSDRKS